MTVTRVTLRDTIADAEPRLTQESTRKAGFRGSFRRILAKRRESDLRSRRLQQLSSSALSIGRRKRKGEAWCLNLLTSCFVLFLEKLETGLCCFS